jgi:ubiquinone/menaquinone biosynthesis C-methylase UbiE
MSKDLFSGHANLYATFRPTYPEELYQFIFQFLNAKSVAWDCGTGNGQVAKRIAEGFEQVYASDLSESQIRHAVEIPNVTYYVCPAETTPFNDESFDLITVGQALHWFNVEKFYEEVRRVAKPGALLAIWGYGNITINETLDPVIQHLYSAVVGKYWDEARRHVETGYKHIPFPFEEIPSPAFYIKQDWTLQHLVGYLESWSATQRYIKEIKENPVPAVQQVLEKNWGEEQALAVRFPVFLRLAKV